MSEVTVTANRGEPVVPPIESVTITVSPELAKVLCYLIGNTTKVHHLAAGKLWDELQRALDYTPPPIDTNSCPKGFIHFPG